MLLKVFTVGLAAGIALLPTLSSAAAVSTASKASTTVKTTTSTGIKASTSTSKSSSSKSSSKSTPKEKAACTASVAADTTVTVSTYTDLDVFYTTSSVTVYSKDWINAPSPTSSTSSAHPAGATGASAPPSAVPTNINIPQNCAATVYYTPTVTRTTTFTFSHAARATQTAPACAAHNMYNGTVSYNTKQTRFPSLSQPRGEAFPNLATPEQCCNQCYQGSCMYYTFDNIDRDGSWAYGCKIFWADGGCPNGWGRTEALRNEVGEGSGRGFAGLGGCLLEVGYYVAG